jgi:hypothetical protein
MNLYLQNDDFAHNLLAGSLRRSSQETAMVPSAEILKRHQNLMGFPVLIPTNLRIMNVGSFTYLQHRSGAFTAF